MERESTNTTTILNERDIAGLQYLGAYVLRKLYRKHAKANTKESQQAMAILKAGKLEESTHGATTQKLITSFLKQRWTVEYYNACTENICKD